MKKYSNLKFHLEEAGTPIVTMTFAEMGQVLGFPLPSSAGKFKNWWSNTRSGQSSAWQEAGYKADAKSLVFDENAEGRKFDQYQISFVRRGRQMYSNVSESSSNAGNDLKNMHLIAEAILGFDELLQLGHISKKDFEKVRDRALSFL
jgi:hypothetical protein